MFSVIHGLASLKNSLKHLESSHDPRGKESATKIHDLIKKINPLIFNRIEQLKVLQRFISSSTSVKEAYRKAEAKYNTDIQSVKQADAKRKRELEKREVLSFFRNNNEQLNTLFELQKELENVKDLIPFLKEDHSPLNLARELLPQIDDTEDFLEYLTSQHIHWYIDHLSISEIKSSQAEFNREKIEAIKANPPDTTVYLISNDNYLLDGHHRWIAQKETNPHQKVPVVFIRLNILELINRIPKEYGKTSTKTIDS